ncbi:flagellar protein FlaG [Anoxybacillus tepidamans]|uniref:Flagellar protein FlaG n=1 Tax=Anoxybacteroides tepidamans TaxID=265948 RepID=A0A7W8IT42_9BACL|nr:flagellar protein FlaG [Anoxybacillus tepidamans]MBB5326208.1 flagellar protein FlaG [Anoxybacillus tepidamans]
MTIDRISSQPSFSFLDISSQRASNSTTVPSQQADDQPKAEAQKETKESSKELSKDQLENIIKGMNEFLQPSQTSIKFELHDELKEYYVQIVDERTKEVIREIPPKKLLDMYAAMMEFVGLIVDKKI